MNYRLGLDLGTNSIGWAILKLNDKNSPEEIIKLGSRIFSDSRNAKTKASLAVARRDARLMRRNRDRSLQRKKQILNKLMDLNLFPKDEQRQISLKKLDVLKLRSEAVHGNSKLAPFELGRVILHLSKRRGFLSNRKTASKESDTKLSESIEKLKKILIDKKAITVGDYLHQRHKELKSTKATVENGFYLSRELIKEEFERIVEVQKKYHKIKDSDWEALKGYIFYQRPLKPVQVGRCSLYQDKLRAFQYLPAFEDYRLLSNLHNLRWRNERFTEEKLTADQINTVFENSRLKKTITFKSIKKEVGLKESIQFTIEKTLGSGKISGCDINSFFGDTKKGLINTSWNRISPTQKNSVANIFFQSEDVQELETLLSSDKFSFLSSEEKWKLLETQPPKSYSEHTCSFSEEALLEILKLSLDSGEPPGSIIFKIQKEETLESNLKKLSYYGKAIPTSVVPIPEDIKLNNSSLNNDEKRYGKISNPTVHVGLRQIEKLINELIDTYGKPTELHIEFAREIKLNKKAKDNLDKQNKENKKINDKAKDFILSQNSKPNRDNMERVKLWFEMENKLECQCAYSGDTISQRMVLSPEVEVDHILPFSRTLDNSRSNKALVLASENRIKGNKTPYEAFGSDEIKWTSILARASRMPASKDWRFSPDAMDRFEKGNGFLDRQLHDTSYLSKISKSYLGKIVPQNKIVVTTGRLTSLVRAKLGLNKVISTDANKNRNDHRHHAIDALVISLIDRSFLLNSSKETSLEKIIFAEPIPNLFKSAEKRINEIVVSHKVDHGENKVFAEQTGFGLHTPRNTEEDKNNYKLITTKSVLDLKDSDIKKIVSSKFKKIAEEEGLNALSSHGVKRLKVFDVCKEEIEKIGSGKESYILKVNHGKNNEHSVYYKKDGTYALYLWRVPLKNNSFKIEPVYLYHYDFLKHKNDLNSIKPHPAAKLVCKIHKGDTVVLNKDGEEKMFLVKILSKSSNRIEALEINKASKLKSDKAFLLSVSKFKEKNFRKVKVTSSGKVYDGGPIL